VAVPVKFIQFFGSSAGYGWSEIHYKLWTGTNPPLKDMLADFNANVVLARKELLGVDCQSLGCRASYPRNGAIASKPLREAHQGNAVQKGAAPSLSLAINFADTTSTRNKTLHLRGFWDSVEDNEFYDPNAPGADGWNDRLTQWKAALFGGKYGWMSKAPDTSAKGVVTNYAISNTNIVTFTLEAPGITVTPITPQFQVRFSKLNHSNSLLNKSILVQKVSNTELVSVFPHAAGAFGSKGRFNFRATDFVQYADVNSISLGKRQMGKSLFLSVARGKVKPTV